MTPALLLWPEAQADLREARSWYEERRKGLGRDFLGATREVLATIERFPLHFPRVRGEVRRAPLHRFPYALYYLPEAEKTVVLACFHARRAPKLLQIRLTARPT
jgi:plasmid stabilization system protein ParE